MLAGRCLRALSVRQPWADAIVLGYKHVENRKWAPSLATMYRHLDDNPLVIHASKKFDELGARRCRERGMSAADIDRARARCGGFVGDAIFCGILTACSSVWFEGPIGWVLANGRAVEFLPAPGTLGFFPVPLHAVAHLDHAAPLSRLP